MLNENQLHMDLKDIFYTEEKDMSENDFHPKILMNRLSGPKAIIFSPPENKIILDVPNTYLIYENLDLLLKLYAQISHKKKLKTSFLTFIIRKIADNTITLRSRDGIRIREYRSLGGLAVWFLFRVNELQTLKYAMEERRKNELNFDDIAESIKDMLRYEWYRMNEDALNTFDTITSLMYTHKYRVKFKLSSIN